VTVDSKAEQSKGAGGQRGGDGKMPLCIFFISEGMKVDNRRLVGSVHRLGKKRPRWEASDRRPH
jgi:hypothetical protein